MVTIVTGMACASVGIVLGFKQITESIYTDDPFAINYLLFEKEGEQIELKNIDQELNQANITYHALSKIGLSENKMKSAATIQIAALFFIPLIVASTLAVIGSSSSRSIYP